MEADGVGDPMVLVASAKDPMPGTTGVSVRAGASEEDRLDGLVGPIESSRRGVAIAGWLRMVEAGMRSSCPPPW